MRYVSLKINPNGDVGVFAWGFPSGRAIIGEKTLVIQRIMILNELFEKKDIAKPNESTA